VSSSPAHAGLEHGGHIEVVVERGERPADRFARHVRPRHFQKSMTWQGPAATPAHRELGAPTARARMTCTTQRALPAGGLLQPPGKRHQLRFLGRRTAARGRAVLIVGATSTTTGKLTWSIRADRLTSTPSTDIRTIRPHDGLASVATVGFPPNVKGSDRAISWSWR
jgi:hypothetical protein